MAQLDAREAGDYGPWPRMHHNHHHYHHGHMFSSPPRWETDWARMDLPSTLPSPRRRRWGDIHRPAHSVFTAAAPSSVATFRQRPAAARAASLLLSSPSPLGMRHHSSDTPLLGRPSAVPSLPRASTAPTGKAAAFHYYGARSRSGSRTAASHREPSPRSAHYYRSTPNSRRSMRSSVSESDGETDVTQATPTEDDDEDDDEGNDVAAESIFVDKDTLRDRLNMPRHESQKQRAQRAQQAQQAQEEQQAQLETEEESTLLEQPDLPRQPEVVQRQKPKRSYHKHHHRHSSGSRGVGGSSSSRGRRPKSVILEEVDAEEQQADADTELDPENDEDDGHRPRRTPSRHASRNASRHTSRHSRRSMSRHTIAAQDWRRDQSRSKSRSRRDGSPDDWNLRASSRRPSTRYAESELPAAYATGPASLRRTQTYPTAPSYVTAPPTVEPSRRPSSLLDGSFNFTTHGLPAERLTKRYDCSICMEEVPPARAAKLKCGHRICARCLKNKYKQSMTDSRQMPPRCCTSEPIALKHVEKLFDDDFKQAWNNKFRRHSTRNRIYCPSTRCGEWIKPEDMFREENRETARCSRCKTKVCCLCNGKWHASRECPRDEATREFAEAMKREGNQRCYKCRATVKLQKGRNHMVCRCGAASCMICGTPWKTCDCPVFDCDNPEADRFEQLQNRFNSFRDGRFGSTQPSPGDMRSSRGGRAFSTEAAGYVRPHSYDEQTRLRQRADDYRTDDLTRRMQAFGGFQDDDGMEFVEDPFYRDGYGPDPADESVDDYRTRYVDDGFNMRPRRRKSFVDDDDRSRAAPNVLPSVPQPPPAPPTPPQQQAQPLHWYKHQQHSPHAPYPPPPVERVERVDVGPEYYAAGVNRARGVRGSSRERRLADRFEADPKTKPLHRPPGPPGPPGPPLASAMAPMPIPMGVGATGLGGGGGGGGYPMGAMSSVGPLPPPPIGSMSAPPLPPPGMGGVPMMPLAPMASMASMAPMAPLPPLSLLPDTSFMRRHTMEHDPFAEADMQAARSSERMYTPDHNRHMRYDDDGGGGGGADVYGSGGTARRQRRRTEGQQSSEPARTSVMAGLTGPGRGMDRVQEWRTYVEPGSLDSDHGVDVGA
ncbi:Zinc finger, C6HC-type [Niveomyces insectorum RCEF 264]|uniref:RBR-type E3 ubiquitin transferase n=1 Tax=Niveomyces insectorum RCEF 264 TaxID=1081102 RepID=A0A167Y7K0_9HYPO|nr:Zinc finger, C6HC-type [Niveomyces insectorum RCEF 264]